MESTPTPTPTPTLANLIDRLRLYKPQSEDDDLVQEAAVDGDDDLGLGAESTAGPGPGPFRPKRAAVLICLFEDEGSQIRVILTKRSSTLSTHSGEVSLPGGKAEEGDADERETALREAKEEIGLDPSLVTVLAVLEPFWSKHLLRVFPVVGVLSNRKAFTPVPNSGEVETVFDAPLEMFLKNENWRSEEQEWMGNKFAIHYFDFETESRKFLIWGMTASILIRTASVAYDRPPAFPEQKIQVKIPRFITEKNSELP